MRAAPLLCLGGCLLLAGCVNRDRLNDRCEWRDAGFPVDRNNRDHQRHLIEDVRAAEELGIRFGDAVRARQGVAASLREREKCTSALFAEIVRLHAVGSGEVARLRGHRDLRVDAAAVLLPIALLFVLAAYHIAGRIRDRFPADEWAAALVATLLLSVFVSGFALAIGDLWSWMVESLRLGNTHLSYRAAYRPWRAYRASLLVLAIAAFWAVAVLRYRRGRLNSTGR